jgi:RNA polymerase sigma-70 factor (ECF subfamily)
MNKHQGIIFKVSRMYCDNEECRKDLFQDILLQLWKSYPKYNHDSKFSSWMYRVALNTAISQFRNAQKETVDFFSQIPVDVYDETLLNEKEESSRMLYDAIARLSMIEKSIIILYLDDYQYNDISEILGITVSNVGVQISRIKTKLQKILKDMGYEF